MCLPLACGGADPASSGGDGASETAAAVGEDTLESGDSADDSTDETEPETGADTDEPQCDLSMPELVEQAFVRPGESHDDVALSACEHHVWWVSAGKGAETTISIAASQAVDVAISYPDDPNFVSTITSATLYQPGTVKFASPRSGEFAVVVRAQNPSGDPELVVDYDLAVACTNSCERETTRFPIVMVHGWTGFENIGPLTYYYKVQADLEGLSYPLAIAILDPYNSVEVRGEQLAAFVAVTLKSQRARKVNFIGHSQGGIDARYVAAAAKRRESL